VSLPTSPEGSLDQGAAGPRLRARGPRRGGVLRALLLLLGILPGAGVAAEEPAEHPAPFVIRDLNPFIQVFGLPPFDPAELLPAGRAQVQLAFDVANNAKLGNGANESITLDGETYRLALSVRRGFSDWLQAGVELPFVFHRAGLFDPFIKDWHALLGLPNGDRALLPDNALDYSHRYQGRESMAVRTGQQGLGDLRLFAATPLHRATDGARELSLHASLKLPTGQAAQLLGSGSVDLAVTVNAVERGLGSVGLTGFGRLGVMAMGDGDVLPAQQRHAVAFGGLGLDWRAWGPVDLKVQLDVHGPIYRSELLQLDAISVLLTVGGTIRLGSATSLDLAIGENLFIDTTPDVIANITLAHRL
jgi:hypothetical protein